VVISGRLLEMAREIVEVRYQVAISERAEEDAPVVRDDRDVQA
jgi:hypothetical protein